MVTVQIHIVSTSPLRMMNVLNMMNTSSCTFTLAQIVWSLIIIIHQSPSWMTMVTSFTKIELKLRQRIEYYIHGFVFFPPHLLPNLCNTRTNYSLTYNIPFAHTTSLQHSSLHTVLHFWNNLPEEAVSASSVSSFKHTTRPLFS